MKPSPTGTRFRRGLLTKACRAASSNSSLKKALCATERTDSAPVAWRCINVGIRNGAEPAGLHATFEDENKKGFGKAIAELMNGPKGLDNALTRLANVAERPCKFLQPLDLALVLALGPMAHPGPSLLQAGFLLPAFERFPGIQGKSREECQEDQGIPKQSEEPPGSFTLPWCSRPSS